MSNTITLPEPLCRLMKFAGKKRNEVSNPCFTARECIAMADQVHAHAAAVSAERDAEMAGLREDLQFVERWANHHASKPHTTPQEALSVIQHYPPIKAITKGYADGKVPDTFDPFARIKVLEEVLRLVMGCAGSIDSATDAELDNALSCGDADTERQANAWLVARAALGDKTT